MPPKTVVPPKGGVWRVGREPDPLMASVSSGSSELSKPGTGNRFDSPTGEYGVRYFASTLDGCFGETLARFRADRQLAELIGNEWSERGFMDVGDIPADWRQRRTAVQVVFADDQSTAFASGVQFLDIESLETREAIRPDFGELLAYYGYPDLDVPVVRGHDRRVTRYISQWAFEQQDEKGSSRYAGIRYLSRLDSKWELWAVFDDVDLEVVAKRPILPRDPPLVRVAKIYGLTPY